MTDQAASTAAAMHRARASTPAASELPGRPAPKGIRRSHPLLGVFPLAVMALATILVLFVVTMAGLQDSDNTLRATPESSVVATVPA
jgi:hypothetical protein